MLPQVLVIVTLAQATALESLKWVRQKTSPSLWGIVRGYPKVILYAL